MLLGNTAGRKRRSSARHALPGNISLTKEPRAASAAARGRTPTTRAPTARATAGSALRGSTKTRWLAASARDARQARSVTQATTQPLRAARARPAGTAMLSRRRAQSAVPGRSPTRWGRREARGARLARAASTRRRRRSIARTADQATTPAPKPQCAMLARGLQSLRLVTWRHRQRHLTQHHCHGHFQLSRS